MHDTATTTESNPFAGHTPGAWITMQSGDVHSTAGRRIATVYHIGPETQAYDTPEQIAERNANSRLIAAAPRLLAERNALALLVEEARAVIDTLRHELELETKGNWDPSARFDACHFDILAEKALADMTD